MNILFVSNEQKNYETEEIIKLLKSYGSVEIELLNSV